MDSTKRYVFTLKAIQVILMSSIFASCTFFSNISVIKPVSDSSTNGSDDLEPPRIGFSTSSVTVAESTSSVLVAVSLSKPSDQVVSIDFSISGSSTAAGGNIDYNVIESSLVFAAGETSKNISVDIIDDVLDEDNENVILTLSNPVSATINHLTSMTITITDDDLPPIAEFSTASQTVAEAAGTQSVSINLSSASSKIVTVPVSLNVASTAVGAGVDYTLSGFSVAFNPGETSKQLTLNLVDDGLSESDESIVLDFGAITNATAGALSTQTITLTSEDLPPTAPTALILGSIPKTLNQSPTLSWTAVGGASYYEAQIFDSTGITPVSSLQTLISGSSISSLSLSVSTIYTFKVRAIDGFGNVGAWASTTWTSFCDETWSNTVIAMELNGANASTIFSDVSNANKTPLTAVGNAQLSTVQKFNGTASAYFDGSGDYITTPTSADWEISGDYTIEARIYVSSGQLNPIATAISAGDGWGFFIAANGSIYFNTKNGATNITASSAAGAVSALAWHHVAAVRSGSDLYVYVDGFRVATNVGSPLIAGTYATWLGGSTTDSFNGYIDDFKVTKGVARYTSGTYTVPNKTLLCQ